MIDHAGTIEQAVQPLRGQGETENQEVEDEASNRRPDGGNEKDSHRFGGG